MAVITNTIQTFDRKGLREDLSNFIFNISPTETPFISNCGRESATNLLHEWQTDSLASVDTTNYLVQGTDPLTFGSQAATTRWGNYVQTSYKTAIVAGVAEAVNAAGRKSEMALQVAKRGKELKRDMEAIALNTQGGSAGNSSTATKLAALLAWVASNTDFDATTTPGADPVNTSGVPSAARTDGTLRAFSETILKNVMQQCFTSGADVSTMMVGPVNKQRVSGFAGIAEVRKEIAGNRPAVIVGAADLYVSDFGNLAVVPNRFQRERDAWFLDFEYLSIATLRPMFMKDLAESGDAKKKFIGTDWTLVVKNEAALGGAFDLTTT